MSVALGLALGAGVLLVASPWLWPARGPRITAPWPADGIRRRLREAGVGHVPVAIPVVAAVLCAAVLGTTVLAFVPVPALAVAVAGAGAVFPIAVLDARARSRRRAVRRAWPDLIDHLVAGIRAGMPLPDALTALGDVGPAELRDAFRGLARAQAGGATITVGLDRLKDDLADPVADRLVETIRVAREVGGAELPGVLRALASSLRQESAARAEVEARQSWIRAAARLGVLAPWVVLALLGSRAEAAAAYNSPAGVALLAGGLATTLVAYRAMVAIGRLPDERRWFA